ncbi:MAG: D-hexose-6-phosphate mutarotase [Arenicella sp.]|nr:D-hexose-6-phosphate mutarotase [Arenicella sp.]
MAQILDQKIDCIEMHTQAGACAVISLHGGQLLSWKPLPHGQEQLYLSKTAVLDGSSAIRGGVPILFPHFGMQGDSPNHGFARLMNWRCVARIVDENSDTVHLELSNNEETKVFWRADFNLRLIVTLFDSSIHMHCEVTNTGGKEFSFSGGLHTYLLTHDISKTRLSGLHKCAYVEAGKRYKEEQQLVEITGETDRVYFTDDKEQLLQLISPERRILIESSGFKQTVVWNPWIEGARKINDMEDQDYLKMLCVESVLVTEKVCLQAGQSWGGSQRLKYLES